MEVASYVISYFSGLIADTTNIDVITSIVPGGNGVVGFSSVTSRTNGVHLSTTKPRSRNFRLSSVNQSCLLMLCYL